MVLFYSPEWLERFNGAVADLELPQNDVSAPDARRDHFVVAQRIHGGPDGDLLVMMVVEDERMRLVLGKDAVADSQPSVTISLSYEDAVAMSKGELDPAEALGQGRVRVRGDLAVLATGQTLLAAARDRLVDLQAATTY